MTVQKHYLRAGDNDKIAAFYLALFGYEGKLNHEETAIILKRSEDEDKILIIPLESDQIRLNGMVPFVVGEITDAQNITGVEDIDTAIAKVIEAGGELNGEIAENVGEGGPHLFVRMKDPEGNNIELFQYGVRAQMGVR